MTELYNEIREKRSEDGINHFMTEAVIILCGANQWTGFYMITASVMKGLSVQ